MMAISSSSSRMFSWEAACGIRTPGSRRISKNLRCFMSGLGFFNSVKDIKKCYAWRNYL
jgi:hypothetical protein